MDKQNNYNEERFDSFLNKTIVLASKLYFKRQMRLNNREQKYAGDNDLLSNLFDANFYGSSMDIIEFNLQLNNAINTLSAIEQAVIFLLFYEDNSQSEAADMLNIYRESVGRIKARAIKICKKSVSRIKIRAIDKLRKLMEGEL